MANEPLALAIEPEAPSEQDYRAFCAALSESARGRAFLAEYTRRQRAAETGMLLAAVERLEGLVCSQTAPPPEPSGDAVRRELLALLDGMRDMQAEIDAGGLTMQVAKLASLIDVVQQRLAAIVALAQPEVAAAFDESAADELPQEATQDVASLIDETLQESEVAWAQIISDEPADVARDSAPFADETTVEIVDEPPARIATLEQMESPTPPPAVVVPEPAIAPAAKSAAIPEVSRFDGAPAAGTVQEASPAQPPARSPTAALAIAAVIEAATTAAAEPEVPGFTVFKAGTIPPPSPFAGEDFSRASRPVDTAPPADPLAPITSLSEEERLALFT